MRFHFTLVCPGCNKATDHVRENDRNPRLKCGTCLMERGEMLEYKVVKVVVECPHCRFGFPPSLIRQHIAEKH